MDKRCKNCIHKGYQENDKNETWGFCLCKDKKLRQTTCEWLNHINRYSIKLGVKEKYKEFPKDNVPSCQLVQASYQELYGISCPHLKELKGEV